MLHIQFYVYLSLEAPFKTLMRLFPTSTYQHLLIEDTFWPDGVRYREV